MALTAALLSAPLVGAAGAASSPPVVACETATSGGGVVVTPHVNETVTIYEANPALFRSAEARAGRQLDAVTKWSIKPVTSAVTGRMVTSCTGKKQFLVTKCSVSPNLSNSVFIAGGGTANLLAHERGHVTLISRLFSALAPPVYREACDAVLNNRFTSEKEANGVLERAVNSKTTELASIISAANADYDTLTDHGALLTPTTAAAIDQIVAQYALPT